MGAAAFALAASLSAPAMALVPPGNNGTIKLDGREFTDPGAPDNEPHIACRLQVEFFGFEQGNYTSTMTFKLHPPTGAGVPFVTTAFVGEDPAGGAPTSTPRRS